MLNSDNSESNGSSYTGSVRGQNGVISTGGSCEDEEYGDVSSVKKMDAPTSTAAYDEQEQAQEQTNKVNSLCADFNYFICLCVPRASGPGDMVGRMGRWFWGQSDQFISSIIGKQTAAFNRWLYTCIVNHSHLFFAHSVNLNDSGSHLLRPHCWPSSIVCAAILLDFVHDDSCHRRSSWHDY